MKPSGLKEMREAARSTVTIRHTYNLVDLRSLSRASPAPRSSARATARAVCRSTMVRGFTPKDPTKKPSDPNGLRPGKGRLGAGRARISLRLADEGQYGDRIVKYYRQLHYGIKRIQELRSPGARQLLPVELSMDMTASRKELGVIRAEPARVTDWRPLDRCGVARLRPADGAYAALACDRAGDGLPGNSAEQGAFGPRGWNHLRSRLAVDRNRAHRLPSRTPSITSGSRRSPGRCMHSSSAFW